MHDISKDLLCGASNMMQHLVKDTYRPIATTKAFWFAMFQWSNWISSWSTRVVP